MFDSYRDLFLSLKPGQMSYGERLLALDMLPLAYDREIKDLVFFYKAVYGHMAHSKSICLVFLSEHHAKTFYWSAHVILPFRPVRPALCKLHILSIL